jgi:hypothetical protein
MRRLFSRSSLLADYSDITKNRAKYLADVFSSKIFCGRYDSLNKLFKKEIDALREHDKYFASMTKLLEGSTNLIKSPTKYKEKLDEFNVYYLDAEALAQALAEKTVKFIADLPRSAKMRGPVEVEGIFSRMREIVQLSTWSYNVLMDENNILDSTTPPIFDAKKVLDMMNMDEITPDLYTIKVILKLRSMNFLDLLNIIQRHSISLDVDCYLMLVEDAIEAKRLDLVERFLILMNENNLSLEPDLLESISLNLRTVFGKSCEDALESLKKMSTVLLN